MVPTVIPQLLFLIPAILSTLSVVREKELGSNVNLYVTPITRLEFLLGKQRAASCATPFLLLPIAFALTVNIYTAATAMPETLHKAPIAIVDEDPSALSGRIRDAFYPPYFLPPIVITLAEMDARMDAGLDTFALHVPSDFERDVLAGHRPGIQLNIDATRMSQAFIGSSYIQTIVSEEANEFVRGHRASAQPPVELVFRAQFNPELNKIWFGASWR